MKQTTVNNHKEQPISAGRDGSIAVPVRYQMTLDEIKYAGSLAHNSLLDAFRLCFRLGFSRGIRHMQNGRKKRSNNQ